MHISEHAQSTDNWMQERVGLVTGSNFGNIFTSTGKKSASGEGYKYKLVTEWSTGVKTSITPTEWMQRGVELEPDAKLAYKIITGHSITEVGLCRQLPDSFVGVSPDGLIAGKSKGFSHGLEIKCPMASNHVKYLLDDKLPTTYIPQVQGSMLITGIDQWDFMSYHPDLPCFIKRIYKDEKLHKLIAPIIEDFVGEMLTTREKLNDLFINERKF